MARPELDILNLCRSISMITLTMCVFTSSFVDAVESIETKIQQNVDKGMAYSSLFPGLADLCDVSQPLRDMSKRKRRDNSRSESKKKVTKNKRRQQLKATKVFNNLYYVGADNVSSWAIDTGESIVLVDALNNNRQAQRYIIDGLKSLGLQDKPISHLIITHGHGDHYGGQSLIDSTYSPIVIMSEKEWNWLSKGGDGFSSPNWGERPTRDKGTVHGENITVGNTTITFLDTPGHTPGTLSILFPVVDAMNVKHTAVLWGGTGLNYGPNAARILSYVESTNRMKRIVKENDIDVFLSNHPKRDNSYEKLINLDLSEQNPFIIGSDNVMKIFSMLNHCTYAQYLKATTLAKNSPN